MSLGNGRSQVMVTLYFIYVTIFVRKSVNAAKVCDDIAPLLFVNSGVVSIKRTDVGFNAFVAVRNVGSSPLQIVGRMLECCEIIGGDENDCTSMKIMGGSMGILPPSSFKNITFLYANMYPYNRRGECSVEIWHKNKKNRTDSIKVSIPFNTYIQNGVIPPSMAAFGDFEKLQTQCESPDMDPLDNCLPVDCHKKYNGNKNFYSKGSNRCVPNPTCYSDPDKDLPDVAYVPSCNECRDVETAISEDDLHGLLRHPAHGNEPGEKCGTTPLGLKEYTNVRCHHGTFDNESTLCECNAGWTSALIPEDIYISSTLLLHFCTIRKPPTNVLNFDPILEAVNSIFTDNPVFVIAASGAISALLFLFVCCCVNGRAVYGSEASDDSCDDDNFDDSEGELFTKYDGMKALKSYFFKDDIISDVSDKSNRDFVSNINKKSDHGGMTKTLTLPISKDHCSFQQKSPELKKHFLESEKPHFNERKPFLKEHKSGVWDVDNILEARRILSKARPLYNELRNKRTTNKRLEDPVIVMGAICLSANCIKRKKDIIENSSLKHYLKAFIKLVDDLNEESGSITKSYLILRHPKMPKKFLYYFRGILKGKLVHKNKKEASEKIPDPCTSGRPLAKVTIVNECKYRKQNLIRTEIGNVNESKNITKIQITQGQKEHRAPDDGLQHDVMEFPVQALNAAVLPSFQENILEEDSRNEQPLNTIEEVALPSLHKEKNLLESQDDKHEDIENTICDRDFTLKNLETDLCPKLEISNENVNTRTSDSPATPFGDQNKILNHIPNAIEAEQYSLLIGLNDSRNKESSTNLSVTQDNIEKEYFSNNTSEPNGIYQENIASEEYHDCSAKMLKETWSHLVNSCKTNVLNELCNIDFSNRGRLMANNMKEIANSFDFVRNVTTKPWRTSELVNLENGENQLNKEKAKNSIALTFNNRSSSFAHIPVLRNFILDEMKMPFFNNNESIFSNMVGKAFYFDWLEFLKWRNYNYWQNTHDEHYLRRFRCVSYHEHEWTITDKNDYLKACLINFKDSIIDSNESTNPWHILSSRNPPRCVASVGDNDRFYYQTVNRYLSVLYSVKSSSMERFDIFPQILEYYYFTNRLKPLYSLKNKNYPIMLLPSLKNENVLPLLYLTSHLEKRSDTIEYSGRFHEVIENSNSLCYNFSQKSLIPVLKPSPKGLHKSIPITVKKASSDKCQTERFCLQKKQYSGSFSDSKIPSCKKTENASFGADGIDKTSEVHNELISSSLPVFPTLSNISCMSIENPKSVNCPSSSETKSFHLEESVNMRNLKSTKTINITMNKPICNFSKRPKYQQWENLFKAHDIDVTSSRLRLQYKTIRSFEHAIMIVYRCASGETASENRKKKHRKLKTQKKKEDLEAVVVFGTSLGEMKKYNHFVTHFVELYDNMNLRIPGNGYGALFADIRPGSGVFDPNTFPNRGIVRIQNLNLSRTRQLLGTLLHSQPTPFRYMLIVLGQPGVLNIIERYSILIARERYRRELKVHKVSCKVHLYEYILKNILYLTPSQRKSAVEKELPILRILWRALLFLPQDSLDEYTFVRSINFVAELFSKNLFRSAKECCNELQRVKEMFESCILNAEHNKLPFSVVEVILKNVSTMKKREMVIKLAHQRVNNLNQSLVMFKNQAKTNNTLIQVWRDLDNAVIRYHEAINEFVSKNSTLY